MLLSRICILFNREWSGGCLGGGHRASRRAYLWCFAARVNTNPKKNGICDIDGSELYQRDDDKVETVTKRIRVYLEQTMPLVEHYRRGGKLLEIDGTQTVEQVTKELLSALYK